LAWGKCNRKIGKIADPIGEVANAPRKLRNAKINTLGARAEDTFWVAGKALEQAAAMEELRTALLEKLG
jgi:UTP:GlnB (protein PII) uridylyltransferase